MSTDHPDFEALSAHFDGEGDGAGDGAGAAPGVDVAAHVAGCAECRTKLRWLRTASALVATPVPPRDPSTVDEAIDRALDFYESGSEAVEQHLEPAVVAVAPRVVVPPRTPAVPITTRGRHRRQPSLWVGIGSAAAVLLAFVVGVSALTGGGGGGGGGGRVDTFAAGPTQERTTTGVAGDAAIGVAGGSAVAAAPGGVDGGDLGDVGDAATLAARARPVLTQRQALAIAPSVASADTSEASPPTPKVVGTRPCEMEVRTARPGLGTVVYYATGRVEGVPVVVLGFAPVSAPAPVSLLALAPQEGCRVVLEAVGP